MATYTTAQIMMTLSAIAYVDDKPGHSPEKIGEKISNALSNGSYATDGKWRLVWGPIVTPEHDNLAFIAQNGSEMAVVLRGTAPSHKSLMEDIPTGQDPFPNAPNGAKVSHEFLHDGLLPMLQATSGGLKMAEFLAHQKPQTLYVTGHSQGGGLTPMMTAELSQELARTVKGHAFAPPTSGNPDFASWVGKMKCCTLYINPYDIVPLGYNHIGRIVSDGIPLEVPMLDKDGIEIRAAVEAAVLAADAVGPWAQPDTQVMLPGQRTYPIIPGDPTFKKKFEQAVGYQHSHNTYLSLIGAPPVTL